MSGRLHSWTLVIENDRPPTFNELLGKMHYRERARVVDSWKAAAGWVAKAAHLPPVGRVAITFDQQVPRIGHRQLPDPGAIALVAKAIVDGLVDVQVFAGDTGRDVASITYTAPTWGLRDRITVTLTQVPDPEDAA